MQSIDSSYPSSLLVDAALSAMVYPNLWAVKTTERLRSRSSKVYHLFIRTHRKKIAKYATRCWLQVFFVPTLRYPSTITKPTTQFLTHIQKSCPPHQHNLFALANLPTYLPYRSIRNYCRYQRSHPNLHASSSLLK